MLVQLLTAQYRNNQNGDAGIKTSHFDLGAQTAKKNYLTFNRGMGSFSQNLEAQPKIQGSWAIWPLLVSTPAMWYDFKINKKKKKKKAGFFFFFFGLKSCL